MAGCNPLHLHGCCAPCSQTAICSLLQLQQQLALWRTCCISMLSSLTEGAFGGVSRASSTTAGAQSKEAMVVVRRGRLGGTPKNKHLWRPCPTLHIISHPASCPGHTYPCPSHQLPAPLACSTLHIAASFPIPSSFSSTTHAQAH
jgi:hypothetical protein